MTELSPTKCIDPTQIQKKKAEGLLEAKAKTHKTHPKKQQTNTRKQNNKKGKMESAHTSIATENTKVYTVTDLQVLYVIHKVCKVDKSNIYNIYNCVCIEIPECFLHVCTRKLNKNVGLLGFTLVHSSKWLVKFVGLRFLLVSNRLPLLSDVGCRGPTCNEFCKRFILYKENKNIQHAI
jgi:hypothetical protein